MKLEKMLGNRNWIRRSTGVLATAILLSTGCGQGDIDSQGVSKNIAAVHEIDDAGNRIRMHLYGGREAILVRDSSAETEEEAAKWFCSDFGIYDSIPRVERPYLPLSASIQEGSPYDTLRVYWENSRGHLLELYVKPHEADKEYSAGGYHHLFPRAKIFLPWRKK